MNSSAVVCREVFDENSQPSAEEINEYAKEIGIDPASETHLLPIAKDGLMHALPHPWKVLYDEKSHGHYYYNSETKASQWDHPVDQVYKGLVLKARTASERGDSVLDDTCASVQDLVTFEETSKYGIEKADGKDKVESQIEDISFDSSIGDEPSTGLKNFSAPLTAITVRKAVNTVPKYNLAPLSKKSTNTITPTIGFGEKKLGDIKSTLSKKIGDSSLLAKPLQASHFTNLKKLKDTDNYSDDEFISEHTDPKLKLALRKSFDKGIIDLSIKPSDTETGIEKYGKTYRPTLEKGLTLSGGGSIFLKSNKNSAAEKAKSDLLLFLESNKSKGSTKSTPAQSPSSEHPKSILRDRSYDSNGRILSLEKLNVESFDAADDDKKSVRFNLDKANDICIEFSLSPSSNSSSDLAQDKHNSIISNIPSDADLTKPEPKRMEPFFNPTSNPFFSDPLTKNPFKPGKLSPITRTGVESFKSSTLMDELKKSKQSKEIDCERVKKSAIIDEVHDSNPERDTHCKMNKSDLKSNPAPLIKKLIKPNPNDYIRPSLFQKSFDRISDMIKPMHIDSDSDNDLQPSPRSPPYPQRNKISIKLMESIDSEASLDSPDRDMDDIEANFMGVDVTENQNVAEKDSHVHYGMSKQPYRNDSLTPGTKMENFKKEQLEKDMKKSLEEYKLELKERNSDEKKCIEEEMDQELTKIRQNLHSKHESEKSQLKIELEDMAAVYKTKLEKAIEEARCNHEGNLKKAMDSLNARLQEEFEVTLARCKEETEKKLCDQTAEINQKYAEEIAKLKDEKKNSLNILKSQLENGNAKAIIDLQDQYLTGLEQEKVRLNAQNQEVLDKTKQEHEELCNEIRKDYRTEVDLLRGQHTYHLSQLREKLEAERRRARDSSDEPSYDRLKTDKRLLDEKYKCLKEKYARLKSDVKLSIERRNKRREQSLTTGSETERSNSNRNEKSGEVLEIPKKDLNEPKTAISSNNNTLMSHIVNLKNDNESYIQSPKRTRIIIENNNPSISEAPAVEGSSQKVNTNFLSAAINTDTLSDRSPDNSRSKSPNLRSKSPLSPFFSRQESKYRNSIDDNSIGANDTSLSQSDGHPQTKPPKASKPSVAFKSDFDKKRLNELKSDGAKKKNSNQRNCFERAATDYHDSSDNANSSDSRKPKESSAGRGKRKSFTRHKSASTSRLNYSPKHEDRPCSPVENLRQQLRKLEDLEDQFPDLTIQVDTAAYRLRYPFADFGDNNLGAAGARASELEFVAHRALVERERVRRARASLRRRKQALREKQGTARQKEQDQDEHELTDMEISLHRTRSLLGEKVIRLRHIEKILRRMTETSDDTSPDNLGKRKSADGKQNDDNKDTTLSDISSHSSGFSSTEGHSELNERRSLNHSVSHPNGAIYEQSNEIMTSLENLNTEIRDIWNVLHNQQQAGNPKVLPPGQLVYTDLGWPLPLQTITSLPNTTQATILQTSAPTTMNMPIQSIPTLADRLHAYRQMVANPRTTATTVVSQAQSNGGVATSLVERTKDLRDWLKQQASL